MKRLTVSISGAIEIGEKTLEADHPSVATVLNERTISFSLVATDRWSGPSFFSPIPYSAEVQRVSLGILALKGRVAA